MSEIKGGKVISVTAKFECAGCGKHFSVPLDTAQEADDRRPDLVEMALTTLGDRADDGDYFTSFQAGRILCGTCTQKVDDFMIEAHGDRHKGDPTDAEFTQALAEKEEDE